VAQVASLPFSLAFCSLVIASGPEDRFTAFSPIIHVRTVEVLFDAGLISTDRKNLAPSTGSTVTAPWESEAD